MASHYRKDIDGFRAVAVTSVILYHLEFGVSGGYVGVDLFFVISGYLITGLIESQVSHSRFDLREFWTRRIRRLWPAHAVHLLAVTAASWYVLLPSHFADFGQSLVSQPLLSSNIYYWRTSVTGYFGEFTEYKPLLHTWSLAVEEQFYLFYPLILVPLIGCGRRIKLLSLLAIAACSYAFSAYVTHSHPMLAFFCLPARACELLLGALAYYLPNSRPLWARTGWFLGLATILLSFAYFPANPTGSFPGSMVLWPCLGMALLLRWETTRGLFVWAPVVFLGQCSYSLYLWHWPVWALAKYFYGPALPSKWVLLAVIGSLSVFTWQAIEKPVRYRKLFKSTRSLISSFVASSVLFVSAGSYLYLSNGLPGRFPTRVAHYETARQWDRVVMEDGPDNDFPIIGRPDVAPKLLLWGDSHGAHLTGVLNRVARRTGTSLYVSCRAGVPLYCRLQDPRSQQTLKLIKEKHICKVFLAFRWPLDPRPGILADAIKAIRACGAEPVLITNLPSPGMDWPVFLGIQSRYPEAISMPEIDLAQWHTDRRQWMQQAAGNEKRPDVIFLGQGLKDSNGKLTLLVRDTPTFWDTNHLTRCGAILLEAEIQTSLKEAMR